MTGRKGIRLHIIRAAVIIIAAVLIYAGINRGEAVTVLQKAVMVCLQCVGIG